MTWQITRRFALAGVLSVGLPGASAQVPGVFGLLATASYLGVGIMEVRPDRAQEIGLVDPHGVEISSVGEDSPALRAGLEQGDIVLTYRDERVNGIEHFARLVRETPVGGKVELGVVRAQDRLTVDVEIGRRDRGASAQETIRAVTDGLVLDDRHVDSLREHLDSVRQHLDSVRHRFHSGDWGAGANIGLPMRRIADRRVGLELMDVEGQLARFFEVESGALVRRVLEGSPAEAAGIRAGDVIVGVDGAAVRGIADVRNTIRSIGSGGSAEFDLVRDGETLSLRVEVERRQHRHPVRPVSE